MFSCLFLVFIRSLMFSGGRTVSFYFYLDGVSYPLLVLRSLVVFLSISARLKIYFKEKRLKGYLFTLVFVGLTLFFSFMINTFFGYFVFFELRVLPLIVLITRWGAQKARLQASIYFIFFTMVGSFPLLVFLISFFSLFKRRMMGIEKLVLYNLVSSWGFLFSGDVISLF